MIRTVYECDCCGRRAAPEAIATLDLCAFCAPLERDRVAKLQREVRDARDEVERLRKELRDARRAASAALAGDLEPQTMVDALRDVASNGRRPSPL